jgi:hypothetical protein
MNRIAELELEIAKLKELVALERELATLRAKAVAPLLPQIVPIPYPVPAPCLLPHYPPATSITGPFWQVFPYAPPNVTCGTTIPEGGLSLTGDTGWTPCAASVQ